MLDDLKETKKLILGGIRKLINTDKNKLTSQDYLTFGTIVSYFENYEIANSKLKLEDLKMKLDSEKDKTLFSSLSGLYNRTPTVNNSQKIENKEE